MQEQRASDPSRSGRVAVTVLWVSEIPCDASRSPDPALASRGRRPGQERWPWIPGEGESRWRIEDRGGHLRADEPFSDFSAVASCRTRHERLNFPLIVTTSDKNGRTCA